MNHGEGKSNTISETPAPPSPRARRRHVSRFLLTAAAPESNPGLDPLFAGVTRHGKTIFSKAMPVRTVNVHARTVMVTISLAWPSIRIWYSLRLSVRNIRWGLAGRAKSFGLLTLQRGGPHVLGNTFAPAPGHPAQRSLRLILEWLEPRRAPAANVFSNVADEVTLRQDIAAADSNGFADNTIDLSSSIALSDTTAGPLVIENATSIAKTLTIEAQGTGSVQILGSLGWDTRIFEIVGTGPASVSVLFKEVGITGGKVHDGGVLGGNAALGGGILIDGGR